MKPGTPAGMQLERAVKAIFPASTSSLSFFMCSFTQDFRFGLVRSAIRYVGCLPAPLGTKGCAGSPLTGGTWPGRGTKPGPPPFTPTHPTSFDEKSGGAAFCCAKTGATAAAPIIPAKMAANASALDVNEDIFAPPLAVFPASLPIRLPHSGAFRKEADMVAPLSPPARGATRATTFPAPRGQCILLVAA